MRISSRVKEKLALLSVALIGQHYYRGAPAWTAESLAERLGVPVSAADGVLQLIVRHGILTETADEPPRFLPARALETVAVVSLLEAVRSADEEAGFAAASLPREPEVETLIGQLDEAARQSLAGRSLRDLAGTAVPPSGHTTGIG